MCSELSAASPPYEAATAATVLVYSRSANVLLRRMPIFCKLLVFFTMPLAHNVLCFVSTLSGIELWISPHFDHV